MHFWLVKTQHFYWNVYDTDTKNTDQKSVGWMKYWCVDFGHMYCIYNVYVLTWKTTALFICWYGLSKRWCDFLKSPACFKLTVFTKQISLWDREVQTRASRCVKRLCLSDCWFDKYTKVVVRIHPTLQKGVEGVSLYWCLYTANSYRGGEARSY